MKSVDLFQFDPSSVLAIARLYQRSEESLDEDVSNLKNWMKNQQHLPEILDSKSLQNFLILNKFSIERSKESIDMYYTLRSRIPDMYERVNPKCPNMKNTFKMTYWVPLPKLTKDMHRVLFYKLRSKEMVDKMDPYDVVGLSWNFQEIRLKEDVMFGDIFIFDMEGLTLGYLTKLTPSFIAKVFAIYGKVFSIPLKGIFIINSNPYITTLITIMKTFMKPKLHNRIHVCQDISILKERFPREILPKDYGGDERSLEELQELLQLTLDQYQDRFDELDKLRVNENFRAKKLENDAILGFHGNFKKLNVD